MDGKQLK
jgi:hypothetical protein